MNSADFTTNAPGQLVALASGAHAFVPKPLPPELSLDMPTIELLASAERVLGRLAGVGEMLPNPRLLIAPFIRREAVLSSRIEGTIAGEQDLVLYKVDPQLAETKPDALEVSNYAKALPYGLKRLTDLPISLRLIRELHEQLLKGVRGADQRPGEFRDVQNYIAPTGTPIAAARYVPPPVAQMKTALSALEKFLHAPANRPLLVDLALIHYQFEAIHPFRDGNGRVGRLLIPLLLAERKALPKPLLYLSAYLEDHRTQYAELLLRVSQTGDWPAWIRFFLQGVAEQAADGVQRASDLMALWHDYRRRLETARVSTLAQRLVDELFLQPAMSVSMAQKVLKVSFLSAQNNVLRLVRVGILREMTGGKRNRIFIAPDIMKITGFSDDDR
jgi:cell filamentation protein, protein adenylyltransferase